MGNRSRRERLWARDPHCFWCGVRTVPHPPDGEPVPPNAATLDHLRDDRGPHGHVHVVLACVTCNGLRAEYLSEGIREPRVPRACLPGGLRDDRIVREPTPFLLARSGH